MADAHAKPDHDYHLVDPSPWPFVGSHLRVLDRRRPHHVDEVDDDSAASKIGPVMLGVGIVGILYMWRPGG